MPDCIGAMALMVASLPGDQLVGTVCSSSADQSDAEEMLSRLERRVKMADGCATS